MRHRRNDLGTLVDDGYMGDATQPPYPSNPNRELQPVLSRVSGHSQHTPLTLPIMAQPQLFGSPKGYHYPQGPPSGQHGPQSKQLPKKLLTPIRNLFGQKTPPEARKMEPRRYSEEHRSSRLRPLLFSRVVSNDSHGLSLLYERRLPLTTVSPSKSVDDDSFKVLPRAMARNNKGFEVIKGMAGPPPTNLPKKPVLGKKYMISGPIGPPRQLVSNFDAPREAPEPPPRRLVSSDRSKHLVPPSTTTTTNTSGSTKKKRKKKRRLKPPIQFDSSKPLPPTPQGSPDHQGRVVPPSLDLVELNFRLKPEKKVSYDDSITYQIVNGSSGDHQRSHDVSISKEVSEPRESLDTRERGEPRDLLDKQPDLTEARELFDKRDRDDGGGRTSVSSLPSHLSTPLTVHSYPGPQPLVRDDDIKEEENELELDHLDDSNSLQFSFIKDNIGGRNTSVKYYKTINPAKDLPTPPPINNTFNEHDLGYEVDEFSDYDYDNNGFDDDDDDDDEVGYNDALGFDDGHDDGVGYNDALGFDDHDHIDHDHGYHGESDFNDHELDYNDDYDVDDYADVEFVPKPPPTSATGDDHSYTDNLYKLKDEETFHASNTKRDDCDKSRHRHDTETDATEAGVTSTSITSAMAAAATKSKDSLEPPPRLHPSIVGQPLLSRSHSSTGDELELSYGDDILQNYLDMGPLPRSDLQGGLHRGDSMDTPPNFAVTPPRLLEQLAQLDLYDPQALPQVALFPPSVAGTVRVMRRRGLAPDTPQAWQSHHQLFLLAAQQHGDLPSRTPGLFRSFHDLIPENINVVERVQEYESFTENRKSQQTWGLRLLRRQLAQLTILEITVERFRHDQEFLLPLLYTDFDDHRHDEDHDDNEDEGTKSTNRDVRRLVNQMMELLGTLELTIDSGDTLADDKRKLILNMMDLLSQLETLLPPGLALDHRLLIMAMMLTLDAIGQRLDDDHDHDNNKTKLTSEHQHQPHHSQHHRRGLVSSAAAINKRDLILNMMSTLATLDFLLPPDEAAAAEVQLRKRKLEKHTRTQPLERKTTLSTVTLTLDPKKRYLWYEDEPPPTQELPPVPVPALANLPMTHASFTKRVVLDDLGEDLIDEINQLPEDFDFEEHERSSQAPLPILGFFRLNLYKNKPIKALVDARYQLNKIETALKTVTFYKKALNERLRLTSRATLLRLQNSFALVTEEDEGDDNTGLWKSHDLPPLPFTLDPKFTHHHNLLGANLHTISEQR